MMLPVGGGSVIDTAKAIAAGALYDGDFWDFFIGRAKVEKALKVAVVLTIPAAGSEGSGNTVITKTETLHRSAGISFVLEFISVRKRSHKTIMRLSAMECGGGCSEPDEAEYLQRRTDDDRREFRRAVRSTDRKEYCDQRSDSGRGLCRRSACKRRDIDKGR